MAVIAAVFLAGNIAAERQLERVDRAADTIAFAAGPSVEELATIRGGTRDVVFLLDNYVDAVSPDAASRLVAMREARGRVDDALARYLAIPLLPGEFPLQQELIQKKRELDERIDESLALAEAGRTEEARELVDGDLRRGADAVVDGAMQILGLDVTVGTELAGEVKDARATAESTVKVTCVFAVLLTVLAAVMVYRSVRRERELETRRVEELEAFAARVSHDIRGPLTTVSLSIDLAARAKDDAQRAEVLQRADRVIGQSTALIDDLLRFAIAGARPIPGASVEVARALGEVVNGLQPKAESAGITLALAPVPPGRVACAAGVFISVVSNLIENAIKYMGSAVDRQVLVNARAEKDHVRVVVRDTGPGVSSELGAAAFSPWVRGSGASQPGIGLGLATVKRLVEAHGGRVGFESAPGAGAAFWFELPSA